jgi:hypothetical protein
MAAAASAIAAALDLPLTVVAVSASPGASPEGMARAARHPALESATADDEWIVTGHHRNDLAETVVDRLARGAGAHGLAGIAFRRGRWIRPLLTLEAERIRSVARELVLPFVDDPANDDRRHRRNRIRHEVLPELDRALGPGVVTALTRAAGLLAADDAALEKLADEVPVRLERNAVLLPATVLTSVPSTVASRAVRRAIRLLRPPYPGSASEVQTVLDVAAGHRRSATISEALQVEREGPTVCVYRGEPPADRPVLLPEEGRVEWSGFSLTSTPSATPRKLLGRNRVIVDAAALDVDATVQAAPAGARIDIGGGTKLVRDAMAEAGIPHRLRSTWPTIVSRGNIVWVAGARTAAFAGPGADTTRFRMLAVERMTEWTSPGC